MLNFKGDTGAFLRSAMGAITLFGVPPEECWPYDVEKFDREPPAFCYSFAKNYNQTDSSSRKSLRTRTSLI